MENPKFAKSEEEIELQVKQIAQRLREERERQRISQIDLSLKAGLSQNQVNYIETGKRTPNLHTVLRICRALQISPAALFEENNKERQEAQQTILRLVSRYM